MEADDLKPADLRGILKYVPLWRDHAFVIALDGSIVADPEFANILVDIAVFRSLQIRVILVHGIGHQLVALGRQRDIPITDHAGSGAVDQPTLELASEASAQVAQALVRGLTRHGLRAVQTNAIRATEVGLIGGTHQGHRGKVDRVDTAFLRPLLDRDIVPVVSPIAYNRDGALLRLDSDGLARDVAVALEASKLIFLSPQRGLEIDGKFVVNTPVEPVKEILRESPGRLPAALLNKIRVAIAACDAGIPRVHLLDGRTHSALLTEVFSQEGIGTMIHGNEYQRIRPARREDVPSLYSMISGAARSETVRVRSFEAIEEQINHFFVYEIDGSLLACAGLFPYDDESVWEIGAVAVQPFFQGRGAGKTMVEFCLDEARRRGARRVFALSTQSGRFFQETCGFTEAEPSDLPARRQSDLAGSGRNSRIFIRDIGPVDNPQ